MQKKTSENYQKKSTAPLKQKINIFHLLLTQAPAEFINQRDLQRQLPLVHTMLESVQLLSDVHLSGKERGHLKRKISDKKLP